MIQGDLTTFNTPKDPSMEPQKDYSLWRVAQKRARFKRSLTIYLLVNLFLWLIWAFKGARIVQSTLPWPAWVSLSWGIAIVFQFIEAYTKSKDWVQHEYEQLTKKNSNS